MKSPFDFAETTQKVTSQKYKTVKNTKNSVQGAAISV